MDDQEYRIVKLVAIAIFSLIALVALDAYLDQKFYHDCVASTDGSAAEIHLICKKHR